MAQDSRLLCAPDPDEEPIPVSPRKLAKLIRSNEELERELAEAREEIRRLREEKARSREKHSALKAALDRLRTSLSVLGTDAKTAASVGVPFSRVLFR